MKRAMLVIMFILAVSGLMLAQNGRRRLTSWARTTTTAAAAPAATLRTAARGAPVTHRPRERYR
jgi:hypothetical protein